MPRPVAYALGDAAVTSALRAWVMNTRSNDTTEYTNYPFNSYAKFNNAYLGAGPSGIFVLSGPDDAGTATSWLVRTGQHDDKKPYLKRLVELLLGVRYDGTVRVRVLKDDSVGYDYVLPALRSVDLQQVRVKTGKGLRSRYFQIELSGSGAHFELDSLQATMPVTTRRVG
jgi:hypothetical protein